MGNNNNFNILYENYKKSNYDGWKKPSVNRINDYEGYEFSNMELITWKENFDKNCIGNKNKISARKNMIVCRNKSIYPSMMITIINIKSVAKFYMTMNELSKLCGLSKRAIGHRLDTFKTKNRIDANKFLKNILLFRHIQLNLTKDNLYSRFTND